MQNNLVFIPGVGLVQVVGNLPGQGTAPGVKARKPKYAPSALAAHMAFDGEGFRWNPTAKVMIAGPDGVRRNLGAYGVGRNGAVQITLGESRWFATNREGRCLYRLGEGRVCDAPIKDGDFRKGIAGGGYACIAHIEAPRKAKAKAKA